MLRATLAVFAAAVGGANRITVLPHTQALALPDAFARRVARNTQLVLREEANLDKVSDPAAGSGGFETLTESLCERGWEEFRAIEAAGGLETALAGDSFRSRGRGSRRRPREKRRAAAGRHHGRQRISRARRSAAHDSARLRRPTPPFAPRRLAEPFEALRDRSDAQARAHRIAAKDLSRDARVGRGLHAARDLRQESVRGRRLRAGAARRRGYARGPRRRVPRIRRGCRVPVLVGRALCGEGGGDRAGARGGRRETRRPRGPSGRHRGRAPGGGRE